MLQIWFSFRCTCKICGFGQLQPVDFTKWYFILERIRSKAFYGMARDNGLAFTLLKKETTPVSRETMQKRCKNWTFIGSKQLRLRASAVIHPSECETEATPASVQACPTQVPVVKRIGPPSESPASISKTPSAKTVIHAGTEELVVVGIFQWLHRSRQRDSIRSLNILHSLQRLLFGDDRSWRFV